MIKHIEEFKQKLAAQPSPCAKDLFLYEHWPAWMVAIAFQDDIEKCRVATGNRKDEKKRYLKKILVLAFKCADKVFEIQWAGEGWQRAYISTCFEAIVKDCDALTISCVGRKKLPSNFGKIWRTFCKVFELGNPDVEF